LDKCCYIVTIVQQSVVIYMKDKKTRRGNGEGSVFRLPNGKWRAEVTLDWIEKDGKKKRITKTKSGFELKRDALAYIPILKGEAPGVNKDITFRKMYELWSAPHFEKVTKHTSDGYKAAFKHCSAIHHRKFASLKTADLQAVIDACEYGRRTKADIKSLMNNLYNYAFENDYVEKNYASFIKLPPKGKNDHDAFSRAERDILWQDYKAGNKFTGEILFMIYTGLRFGEYKKIEREKMHINERYFIGGIKTAAGIDRIIPIANCILSIAEELYNRTDKKYILTVHEKVWYHLYHATLKRLGIRDLDAHCCRHTTATALAEEGVEPAVISAILGHEDYSTTLNYTHISLEKMLEAVDRQYKLSSSSE
jgi:site-specific recombinase XerD